MTADRITRRRRRRMSALQLLEDDLLTDERADYAARLERLGIAMFGELWKSDDSKAVAERQTLP